MIYIYIFVPVALLAATIALVLCYDKRYTHYNQKIRDTVDRTTTLFTVIAALSTVVVIAIGCVLCNVKASTYMQAITLEQNYQAIISAVEDHPTTSRSVNIYDMISDWNIDIQYNKSLRSSIWTKDLVPEVYDSYNVIPWSVLSDVKKGSPA